MASPSAVACRKAAGGNCTIALPIRSVGMRVCATSSPWRVSRARSCLALTAANAGDERRGQRARAADIDIEAGIRRRDVNVERFSGWIERFGDCPSGLQRPVKAFGQNRTVVDCYQMVRASGGEPYLEHIVRAAAGVKYRTAAAFAVRVDQIGDL